MDPDPFDLVGDATLQQGVKLIDVAVHVSVGNQADEM
jgi:hypothetical protein